MKDRIRKFSCSIGIHDWSTWGTYGSGIDTMQTKRCYRCQYLEGKQVYSNVKYTDKVFAFVMILLLIFLTSLITFLSFSFLKG